MPVAQSKPALSALALCAALAAAAPAHAAWRATELGSLGGGSTVVNGLNAAGQVVGASRTASGDYHAVIWQAGRMTDLGTLGGASSWGMAISANGQATGYASLAGGAGEHAFRYDGAGMHDIDTLNSVFSYGSAINSAGQVAGTARLNWGVETRAFRASPGAGMTNLGTLPVPGEAISAAYLINEAGTVSGMSEFGDYLHRHAFVSNGAGMTDIGDLGGEDTVASAINASGQLTGYSVNRDGHMRAFLYDGGALRDLGTLGGTHSYAFAINDAGQIAGASFIGPGTAAHAFLWSEGRMTDLGINGGSLSLNASGQVIGTLGTPTGPGLFLYSGGKLEIIELASLLSDFGAVRLEHVYLNDAGQIAGTGRAALSDVARGFLLTPVAAVPEPAPFATLGLGLALIGLRALCPRSRLKRPVST